MGVQAAQSHYRYNYSLITCRMDDLARLWPHRGRPRFSTGASMSWFLLFIAGLLEVAWAAGLKTSEGFTRLWPSVFTLVTAVGSFVLLALAMRQLPLGTAYAVWTGIGAVGAFVFGIVMLGEAVTVARVASAALIVVGLIGLKLSSGH
jgi:quaternary ammonium compound-resistance protein SugE